eukprot:1483287-Rhodomonas_salina.1
MKGHSSRPLLAWRPGSSTADELGLLCDGVEVGHEGHSGWQSAGGDSSSSSDLRLLPCDILAATTGRGGYLVIEPRGP